MSEVITLSSDDELENPSKKIKLGIDNVINNTLDALKRLNSLTEISTFAEVQREVKSNNKRITEKDSLTIIIENDDITSTKGKNKNHSNNTNNVVIIDDNIDEESPEILPSKPKENNNNDCMVILDDPSEVEDSDKTTDEISTLVDEQNGLTSTSHDVEDENMKIYERPSTSKASDAHRLLDQFLEICANSVKGSKYEDRLLPKFPKMWKHFNNCDNLHNEMSFKRTLEEHMNTAKFSAADAVVSFQLIYSYLLDNINGASVEISENDLRKVKKLEKTCKLLIKKIRKLEEMEIDFDDDNDSTYIQIDRYSQRLNKVYNKYCKLINRNPHAGRLLYDKMRFVTSKYNEINKAITKSYRRNQFPTYYDIEKCIRNCVSENNLNLTEYEIKEESKNCFVTFGSLLQLRRKKELYEIHCNLVTMNEDPATNDQELSAKLQKSQEERDKKMKELVEKYVKLQENNISVDVSEDSDDSDYKTSGSDA